MLYFGWMKGFILLLLELLLSCGKKDKKVSQVKNTEVNLENSANVIINDTANTHSWFKYYQQENPDFAQEKFQLDEISQISYQKSTITVMNEKGFNEIYKPFLIFNKSRNHYLDLDSYQWDLLPDGSAGFEADQAVNLVNLEKKDAQQIAFFGPSFWIEDAYWKGDSVAVLLGNTYEKVPFILEYNFEKGRKKHFVYPDTLRFETSYSKIRLRSKGVKVE